MPIMDLKACAKYLHLSERKTRQYVAEGMPCFRSDGRKGKLLFVEGEVYAWLMRKRERALSESLGVSGEVWADCRWLEDTGA